MPEGGLDMNILIYIYIIYIYIYIYQDPRYGILAVFDREGDRYESIPSAVPVGTGAGRAAAVAQAQPLQGVAPTSGTSAFQGQGQRLGHT